MHAMTASVHAVQLLYSTQTNKHTHSTTAHHTFQRIIVHSMSVPTTNSASYNCQFPPAQNQNMKCTNFLCKTLHGTCHFGPNIRPACDTTTKLRPMPLFIKGPFGHFQSFREKKEKKKEKKITEVPTNAPFFLIRETTCVRRQVHLRDVGTIQQH